MTMPTMLKVSPCLWFDGDAEASRPVIYLGA